MALSGDQKALLRLLAQREQGYEDIASLMGLSVDEVRTRVKDALDAVEREGGEAPLPPVAPVAPAKADKPSATPHLTPSTPEPKPAAKRPAASKPGLGSLPKERRVYAIGAGIGAVVLVIVLLATGVLGGGDSDSSSDSSSATTTGGESQPAAEGSAESKLTNSKLSGAVLKPVDGSNAEGAALFGKAKKEVLLQVEATGLEPSPANSAYTIWFYKSPQLALRVGAVKVPESGNLRVQLPIPEQLLAYVASGVFDQIDVSLTSNAAYKAEVAAAKSEKRLPSYTGTDILRGPIKGPIADAAAKNGG
ncbi:MAG TPA: hypothetical protein VGO66_12275 [Solirubrobacterales bacterium]|nr:hypothetical protein [Solirubrobacterales bacterium]